MSTIASVPTNVRRYRTLLTCVMFAGALFANAGAQAAINLLTPQLRSAQVGEAFADNLVLTSDSALAAVTISGTPSVIIATHIGSGNVAFEGTPTVAGVFQINLTARDVTGTTQVFTTSLAVHESLSDITDLAGANGNYCAVAQGGLRCWGTSAPGTLFNGLPVSAIVAMPVIAANSGVTKVAMGAHTICVVINGGVQCLGNNRTASLGDGSLQSRQLPIKTIPFASGATDIAITQRHGATCAVVAGGVQCWGADFVESNTVKTLTLPTQRIPAGSGATKLTAGADFHCAVIDTGVQCWGNGYGINALETPVIRAVPANSNITEIAAGTAHVCVTIAGGVQCWGKNDTQQVGGTEAQYSYNVPFQALAAQSSATKFFNIPDGTCGLVADALWCWGQVLLMPFKSPSPIVAFPASEKITHFAYNTESICYVTNKQLRCYGKNAGAQLGNRRARINVGFTAIVGAGSNVAAAYVSPTLVCTVQNGGVTCASTAPNDTIAENSSPLKFIAIIAEGSDATAIDSNTATTCAVVRGGVQCWGANGAGILGNGNSVESALPVQTIAANSGVTAVSVGSNHACAILSATVQCWGSNATGQMGVITGATTINTPQTVATLGSGVTAISAGAGYSCAVKNAGLYCWGTAITRGATFGFHVPFSIIYVLSAAPQEMIAQESGITGIETKIDAQPCAIQAGQVICLSGLRQLDRVQSPLNTVPSWVATPAQYNVESLASTCGVANAGIVCWDITRRFIVGAGVAASGANIGITKLAGGTGATLLSRWPCVLASGGVACFFVDSANPTTKAETYSTATVVSTLPDASPDRAPWYRAVSTPAEVFVLTNNPNEYATLAADKANYISQGYMFSLSAKAIITNGVTASPLFKLYRNDIKLNVWTANFEEYQAMRKLPTTFRDDGIDGYIFKEAGVTGTVPIYRFNRIGTAYELMVTNPYEYQFLINSPSWRIVRETGSKSDVMGYVFP